MSFWFGFGSRSEANRNTSASFTQHYTQCITNCYHTKPTQSNYKNNSHKNNNAKQSYPGHLSHINLLLYAEFSIKMLGLTCVFQSTSVLYHIKNKYTTIIRKKRKILFLFSYIVFYLQQSFHFSLILSSPHKHH